MPLIEDIIEPYQLRNRLSFAKAHPDLAQNWLHEKNCGFGPEDFSRGSNVKVWWFCRNGEDHRYQQSIQTHVRCSKSRCESCPFCAGRRASVTNSIARLFPKLAKQWSRRNSIKPEFVVYGSHQQAWWQCKRGHEWLASVKARTIKDSGCPFCLGSTTDLANYPEVLRQFDKKRNNWTGPVRLSPRKKVWWRCAQNKEHVWYGAFDKARGISCPHCANGDDDQLARLIDNPVLRREFHPSRNGSLKARDLSAWSHKKVWWRCARGPDHEWQAAVKDRTRDKTGCPFCSNKKLSVTNSLAIIAPHIACEWHPSRNGRATPQTVVATTMSKYWFLCKNGHEYQQKPLLRVNYNVGCGECYRSRASSKR